nr:Alpha/beta hydrolase family protein [uncultured bacterium]
MKTNILFIHSAGPQEEGVGSSFLIQHLKNQLETDYPLHFPKMPYPESPEYDQWKTRFEEFIMTLSGSALLIGHSIGGSFLIKYLSEASEPLPIKIEALFIMAAPYWGIDEDWQLKDFFLADDFASNLPQDMPIYLYHSIDEATVPFKHHQLYAQKLPQATVRIIDGDSHLFEMGLPELVEDIQTIAKGSKK